jgi:hypothetical protein
MRKRIECPLVLSSSRVVFAVVNMMHCTNSRLLYNAGCDGGCDGHWTVHGACTRRLLLHCELPSFRAIYRLVIHATDRCCTFLRQLGGYKAPFLLLGLTCLATVPINCVLLPSSACGDEKHNKRLSYVTVKHIATTHIAIPIPLTDSDNVTKMY